MLEVRVTTKGASEHIFGDDGTVSSIAWGSGGYISIWVYEFVKIDRTVPLKKSILLYVFFTSVNLRKQSSVEIWR